MGGSGEAGAGRIPSLSHPSSCVLSPLLLPRLPQVTSKSFNFAAKHKLPFFFVSASDGTNVVKIFRMAIMAGIKWKAAPKDDFYQVGLGLSALATAREWPGDWRVFVCGPLWRRLLGLLLGRRQCGGFKDAPATTPGTRSCVRLQEVLDLLGEISVDSRKELEDAVQAEEDKKKAAAAQ